MVERSLLLARIRAAAAAGAVLVAASLVALRIDAAHREIEYRDAREHVDALLTPYERGIEAAIERRCALIEGLRVFVAANPRPTDAEFRDFAQGLCAGISGIRAVIFAPEGINRYVYPVGGNAVVPGHDLLHDPRPNVQADLRRAIATKATILSEPYELRQGGLGMVARRAIFRGDSFLGFVTVVMDVPGILDASGVKVPPKGVAFALRDGTGRILGGTSSVYARQPVITTIDHHDIDWKLAAVPRAGWKSILTDDLLYVRATTAAMVVFLTLFAYLFASRHVRLRTAVAERTRDLVRASRLFRVQSELNRLIVNERNRDRIFSEACRILTEDGLLRMAWIGLASADSGSVAPAASAGHVAGYLDEIISVSDNSPEGSGPTGSAIRSGTPVIVQDIATDPAYAPWREPALARGYRAAATFPLAVDDRTIGALTLYAPERRFFGEEETRLLVDLAADIAFAADFLTQDARRARAEAARIQSEEQYRHIVETSYEGIWMLDADAQTTFVNARMAAMLGYTVEEMIGRSVYDFLFEEDCASAKANIERRRQGIDEQLEFRHRCKDGAELWTFVSARAQYDLEGRFAGVLRMLTDITDRKWAEEEILNLARFPAENPNPVMRVKFDGTVLYANGAAYRMCEACSRGNWRDLPADMRDAIETAFDSGTNAEVEVAMHDRVLAVLVVPFSNAGYANIYATDITARTHAERALRMSEERFRVALDATKLSLATLDRDLRYTWMYNPHPDLAATPDAVIGKRAEDLAISADDAACLTTIRREVLETGAGTIHEYQLTIAGEIFTYDVTTEPLRNAAGDVIGVISASVDITARKRMEDALRLSEERYRVGIEAAKLTIATLDRELRFTWIYTSNKEDAEFAKTVIGTQSADYMKADVRDQLVAIRRRVLETGVGSRDELTSLAEGRDVHEFATEPLRNERGEIVGLISASRKITEQKRMEEALRRSEERFRVAIENGPITMFTLDRDLRVTWMYNPHEAAAAAFVGKSAADLFAPEDAAPITALSRRVIETGEPIRAEYSFTLGGFRHTDDATFEPLRDASGEIVGLIAAAVDVTERKQMEDALRVSEERLRVAVDATKLSLGMLDRNLRYTWAHAMSNASGYTSEQFVGKRLEDLPFLAENAEAVNAVRREVLETGVGTVREVPMTIKGDRRTYEFATEPHRNAAGEVVGIISASMDITERKRMEDEFRASEERFRNVFMNNTFGIYLTTPDGRILLANPALLDMLGYSSIEELAARDLEREGYAEEGARARFRNEIEREGEVRGYESIWARKDGLPVHIRESAHVVRDDDGRTLYYEGTVEDVTERKRMEDALRRSEIRFRMLAENAQDLLYRYRFVPSPGFEYVSPSATRLTGYTPEEIYARPSIALRQVHPEDRAKLHALMKDPERHTEPVVLRWIHRDGAIVWVEQRNTPVNDAAGRVVAIEGIARDVTERVLAETALEQERNLLRTLIDNLPEFVYVKDRQCRFIMTNRAYHHTVGVRDLDTIAELTDHDFIPTEVADRYRRDEEELMRTGIPLVDREELAVDPAGRQRWKLTSKVPLRDATGEVVGLVGMSRDITERKRVQEELDRERNLLRTLIDNLPEFIFVKDRESRFVITNRAHLDALGAEALTEVIGKTDHDLFARDLADAYYRDEQEVMRTGEPLVDREEIVVESGGARKWVLTTKVPLRDAAGEVIGLVGMSRDITARKLMEEALRKDADLMRALLDLAAESHGLTDSDLYDRCLDTAVDLTGSAIGFFHRVSNDQKTIVLTTWDRTTRENCAVSYDADYPLDAAGNWMDCVREKRPIVYNDYPNSPNRRGLPEGHVPVTRLMGVPVIEGDQVRIILGVGNKAENYDDGDVARLRLIGNELHKIMLRRHTETALRESESALRGVLDATTEAVLLFDRSGTVILANEAAARRHGLRPLSILGRNIYDELPKAIAKARRARVDSVFENRRPLRFEDERDGLFIDDNLYPIFDESGAVVRIASFAYDITARRHAEGQMRRSAHEIRLWNRIAEIFLTVPDDQMYEEVLAIVRDVTGSPHGIFGYVDENGAIVAPTMMQDVWDLCRMEDKTWVFPRMAWAGLWGQAWTEKRTIRENREFAVPEGHIAIYSMLAVPIVLHDGLVGTFQVANKPGGYAEEDARLLEAIAGRVAPLLFARVERDRRNAERQRAEAEIRRLITAIEQSGEEVIVTDPDGTIRYVNLAFEKITGYSAAEAIGRKPSILKSGKHDSEFYRTLWETITRGEVCQGRLTNRKKDGTLYQEDASISPVRDADGTIVSYVKVARDVTHELRLEEDFRQAQKMEAIGRLAGGVAHDFNNMLTVITGYGELMQLSLSTNDPLLAQVGEIVKAAQKAAELTRHLLAFSRKAVIRPRVMNIGDTLRNVERMLRRVIGENVRLTLRIDEEGTWNVRTDPGQIEQIVMNLVTNARDAMPDGGELAIGLEDATLDEAYAAQYSEVAPGQYVMLSVRDTGIGMDAATQARIFEPFFTTKGEMGTGLGLATVFGIVKQNGGHITCESEPGDGTTFRVYLPSVADESAEPIAEPPVAAALRGRETILMVEDDESILQFGRSMLAKQGYTVLVAANGADGVSIAASYPEKIHLLFTDVVLPDMNGRQVADRIMAERPDIRVLYASGYAEDVILRKGVLDDDVAFIQKPYRIMDLLGRVRAVIAGED